MCVCLCVCLNSSNIQSKKLAMRPPDCMQYKDEGARNAEKASEQRQAHQASRTQPDDEILHVIDCVIFYEGTKLRPSFVSEARARC